MNEQNIFEKGVLVNLEIRTWGTTKKIKNPKYDKNWFNVGKILMKHKLIKEIEKVRNATRTYLYSISFPFPVRGVEFIPYSCTKEVGETLENFKNKFNKLVDQLSDPNLIQELKKDAKNALKEDYDERDYQIDVKSKYGFGWEFLVVAPPDRGFKQIDSDLYEQEKRKFLEQMNEAKEMIIGALREEFRELVEHIVERTTNPRAIIRDSVVEKFDEFFSSFQKRNCFDDQELTELVEKSKKILKGIKGDDLRTDNQTRETTAILFDSIKQTLDESVSTKTRHIVLPKDRKGEK